MSNNEIPVYSINDVAETLKEYDAPPEIKDILYYFVSDLTGLSVDALAAMIE